MVSVCLAKKPPTYNSPESLFWTSFLDDGLDLQKTPECPMIPARSRESARKAPFNPSRVLNVPLEAPECPKVELWRGQERTTEKKKTPVVEHKGFVGRVGVFLLAPTAPSVASVVGQNSLCVRPMFDADCGEEIVQKCRPEPLYV